MSHQRFSPFIQSLLGGLLAGLSLSEGNSFIMPIGIGFLWSSITMPSSGFFWGLVAILVSHRWLLYLHPLGWVGVPSLLSLPLAIGIWICCGLAGGVLVGAWSCLANSLASISCRNKSFKRQVLYGILLSVVWGLAEVCLAQFPFFWIGVGSSVLPGDIWLAGLARWIGSGGLAFINIFIGWWLWQLVITFSLKIQWNRLFLSGISCLLCAHVLGASLLHSGTNADSIRVAIWQTNIPVREKFSNYQLQKTFKSLHESLEKASQLGASILLAPEGTLIVNQSLISPSPVSLLTGGFREINDQQRSSLLVIKKGDRKYSTALDKHRLVPLGEWVPSWRGLPMFGLSAVGGLEPGTSSRRLEWDGPSLAAAICYEISDGKALVEAVNKGAEWILTLANLDPYPIAIQRQFLSMAQLRSIETDRDLISVSNTGPTALIKGSGRIDFLFSPFKEEVSSIEVDLRKGKTGYMIFGELPLLVIFISALLWAFLGGDKKGAIKN